MFAFRDTKSCTGFKNIAKPRQSVKKPGVIKSSPEIKRKIPPFISCVGNIPWVILRCALNKRLRPCLFTKKIPTIAVRRIIAIVFKMPIFDPTAIKITISIIGIKINNKKIILYFVLLAF